jgi:hypothetical protein
MDFAISYAMAIRLSREWPGKRAEWLPSRFRPPLGCSCPIKGGNQVLLRIDNEVRVEESALIIVEPIEPSSERLQTDNPAAAGHQADRASDSAIVNAL